MLKLQFLRLEDGRSAPLKPAITEFHVQRPYQIDDQLPLTTNADFHNSKPYSKAEQIRSGTASGTRNNNPHPR